MNTMNNFFDDPFILDIEDIEPIQADLEDVMGDLFYEGTYEVYDELSSIETTKDSFFNADLYDIEE